MIIGNKTYGSVEDYINGVEDLEAKEEALKEKLAKQTGNSAIDEDGNIVDISLWRYRVLSEEEKTCEIYGVSEGYGDNIAYLGDFTDDGKVEENIPMFIKIGDTIYKMVQIGAYAFNGAYSLTSIDIPESVISIGTYAFGNCYLLTSIEIPEGVTSVGDFALFECMRLASIEIPLSVRSIGDCAFEYCSALEKVYYTGSEEQWTDISFGSGNTDLTNAEIVYNYTGE